MTYRIRDLFWQILPLVLLGVAIWWLGGNLWHNLETRGLTSGFGFLNKSAGFALPETLIPYTQGNSYGRAVLAGIVNTLHLSLLAVALASVLGFILMILRLSPSSVLRDTTNTLMNTIRNVPLLLQLFLWYGIMIQGLPHVEHAWEWGSVYLSQRGLYLPFYGVGGWNIPVMGTFNLSGGLRMTPEFLSMLIGLGLYSSVFISEILLSGLRSVNKGQREAALSLGMTNWQALRLVLWPQGLRLSLPPLTSQYLSMVKNTSLAIAIGYPDVVGVINVVINHSGQAVEGILLIMAVYLTTSLSISWLMSRLEEKRVRG
jgi:general L-amino acid transport system permease protein